VSLLTRFYDPSNGEILLDGVDLRRYRLADLRDQFAIVLQEPVLFSTSVAANIAYARPGADDRDVVAVAGEGERRHPADLRPLHLARGEDRGDADGGVELLGDDEFPHGVRTICSVYLTVC